MLDDCLCTTHKTDYILEANPIDPKNKETVTVKVHKKDIHTKANFNAQTRY
jgi:hypothetical protein